MSQQEKKKKVHLFRGTPPADHPIPTGLSGASETMHSEVPEETLRVWGVVWGVLFLRLQHAGHLKWHSQPTARGGALPSPSFHILQPFLISLSIESCQGGPDPDYGFFQGREIPVGQTGSHLSA